MNDMCGPSERTMNKIDSQESLTHTVTVRSGHGTRE